MIMPYDKSLLGYWKLDEKSKDYSGNSLHGTDTNVIYNNRRANFNGSTSKIVLPDFSSLTNLQNCSLVASVYILSTGAERDIYELGNAKGAGNAILELTQTSGNKFSLLTWDGANVKEVLSTTAVVANRQYFVVGTRAGATYKMYINGILENTQAAGHTFNIAPINNQIGSHPTVSRTMNGWLNNMMIFNRVLTSNEIMNLYLQSFSIQQKPIWMYKSPGGTYTYKNRIRMVI